MGLISRVSSRTYRDLRNQRIIMGNLLSCIQSKTPNEPSKLESNAPGSMNQIAARDLLSPPLTQKIEETESKISDSDVGLTISVQKQNEEDEGMRIKRLTLLGIVESIEEINRDFEHVKNQPNFKNPLASENEKNELKAKLKKLIERSEDTSDNLDRMKSALQTNQLRQCLSGTAIQG